MTNTKLSAKFPEYGGDLDPLYAQLVRDPEKRHVVVMIVDCAYTKVKHTSDGDVHEPTAGIAYCEPIRDADDIAKALDMLARHRAERREDATLDFDFGVGDPLAKLRDDLTKTGTTVSFFPGASNDDDN